MSYTPTTWVSGDVVTAEKLNKLEQAAAVGGSSGVVLTFTWTNGNFVGDLTWGEIFAAVTSGQAVTLVFKISDSLYSLSPCFITGAIDYMFYDRRAGYYANYRYTMYISFVEIYSGGVGHKDIGGNDANGYPTFTIQWE